MDIDRIRNIESISEAVGSLHRILDTSAKGWNIAFPLNFKTVGDFNPRCG